MREEGREEGEVHIKPLSFCASLVPMVWGPSLSMQAEWFPPHAIFNTPVRLGISVGVVLGSQSPRPNSPNLFSPNE